MGFDMDRYAHIAINSDPWARFGWDGSGMRPEQAPDNFFFIIVTFHGKSSKRLIL